MEVSGDNGFRFENSFASALPELCEPWQAASFPGPSPVLVNEVLAGELGLGQSLLGKPDAIVSLLGVPAPGGAQPVAQVYSGHQFGNFNPRLGDGRALLVGEVVDEDGRRRDLHLKGSGRTPFARGGDGKAALGPMLREYVIGEAMHGLGVPTTRALAVISTGELIQRETPLPGAVLARVASSHLRVGTFEYAARTGDPSLLRRLADYVIERHYPEASSTANPCLSLYAAVVDRQASLVAQWMLVGFIHGVMNTDNMTLSGESIDFGPCAFMDAYDPTTVFSSIDHGGRYAYGNQPAIAQWNLARLGETLLGLIDPVPEDAVAAATEVLQSYRDRYESYFRSGLRRKLGLSWTQGAAADAADALGAELVLVMQGERLDLTSTFRSLSAALREGSGSPLPDDWVRGWSDCVLAGDRSVDAVAAELDAVNPLYVPRNHHLDAALRAATEGDLQPVLRLIDAVSQPFTARPGFEHYADPAPESFSKGFQTFCGT